MSDRSQRPTALFQAAGGLPFERRILVCGLVTARAISAFADAARHAASFSSDRGNASMDFCEAWIAISDPQGALSEMLLDDVGCYAVARSVTR
jgi:hypothetical protein